MQNLLFSIAFTLFSFFSFFNLNVESESNSVQSTEIESVQPPPECLGERAQLRMFFWNHLNSSKLNTLYSHIYYPQSPDGMNFVESLEMPIYFNDSYGALMRGYLLAPETGEYIFNLTGDNQTEFYLSTDDTPANIERIIYTPNNTGVTQHTKYEEEQTDTLSLMEGNYYYFELTLKENSFTDFAKVYWQTPSATNGTWLPVTDTLLYDYTCETLCNPYGTPCDDGDASTTEDIEDGTCNCFGRPATSNACIGDRGNITALYYDGIDGTYIISMDTSTIFPESPTRVEELKFFRGPLDASSDYGTWVKAYMTVPATGKYVFNVTGYKETKLWLSSGESDDPNDLTVIAHVTNNTTLDQHDKYESQTSDSIFLEKGQYYYMELKMKENNGTDHYTVYWKAPFLQDTTWQILTGALLYQYNCESVCTPAGASCDDGDSNTINDIYDENCNCVGTPCISPDCTGDESYNNYEVCNLTDKHSNQVDSWQSCQTSTNPNPIRGTGHWIMYDLNDMYQLHNTHIWNYNKENETGKGLKEVVIDISLDGTSWTQLGNYTWPQASGALDYEGFAGTDYNGKAARYVLITALSNWNGDNCSGFSEIKMNIEACPDANTPCDDGNVHTLDDAYDEFCVCKGVSDGTLALDLLSFDANWDKRNVLVDWQVQNEEAGTYYEVQRSLDAKSFESIGLLRGKANHRNKAAYQLVDTKGYQLANELFYRLKMIEGAGKERFSHVVSLSQTDGLSRLEINAIQPNPFKETVQIEFTVPDDKSKMQLKVFNGQGQFVRHLVNGEVSQGQYQIAWDGTDAGGKVVEAGIYYLQLTDGKQRIGRRVVKL